MTHSRPFRTLAVAISAWLAICLAEPMQLHLCVMHGGLAIESAAHPGGHASHATVSHAAHHSTTDHERSQQCSCLGDCTTGTAPSFVAAPRLRVALPSAGRVDVPSEAAFTLVRAADFVLPFPNGPPGTSSLV